MIPLAMFANSLYTITTAFFVFKIWKWFTTKAPLKRYKPAPPLLSIIDTTRLREIAQIIDLTFDGITPESTCKEQCTALSNMLRTNVVPVEKLLISDAHELFLIHRDLGPKYEGGLSIRCTVQVQQFFILHFVSKPLNLFGGCIANLGSTSQLHWLRGVWSRGELGCFALTEQGAGVLSGLIVETTCKWTETGYILHSPSPNSHKTWISQGLTAKWCVVIARLILKNGVDKGPHAFVIDLDSEGITKVDMVSKTNFNGLDNANISFANCLVPHEALLSKICSIDDKGQYHLHEPNVPFDFMRVSQRLLSGRICLAGGVTFNMKLVLDDVRSYAEHRMIPTGKDSTMRLADLPFMRDELEEITHCLYVYKTFGILNENRFIDSEDGNVSKETVQLINCGKTEIVECALMLYILSGFDVSSPSVFVCIEKILALKLKVGSYCLQSNSKFGPQNEILYAYRFAEGDSGILKQKMARDSLKGISKNVLNAVPLVIRMAIDYMMYITGMGFAEGLRCKLNYNLLKLAASMFGVSKEKRLSQWFESHQIIDKIAKLKSSLLIYQEVCKPLEGTKELDSFEKYISKLC